MRKSNSMCRVVTLSPVITSLRAAKLAIRSIQNSVQSSAKLIAKIVSTEDEMVKVSQLRYEVYIAEQGKGYAEADHQSRQFADDLDGSATVILAEHSGEPVGTVRVNHFDNTLTVERSGEELQVKEFLSQWPSHEIVTCTRLAVRRDRRGSKAILLLFKTIYEYGARHSVRYCLICCSPALTPLFERFGFRQYLPPFAHAVLGSANRLILVLDDAEHYRDVGSPFLQSIRQPQRGAESRKWLEDRFGRSLQ